MCFWFMLSCRSQILLSLCQILQDADDIFGKVKSRKQYMSGIRCVYVYKMFRNFTISKHMGCLFHNTFGNDGTYRKDSKPTGFYFIRFLSFVDGIERTRNPRVFISFMFYRITLSMFSRYVDSCKRTNTIS